MNWIVTAGHQFGAWRTERSNMIKLLSWLCSNTSNHHVQKKHFLLASVLQDIPINFVREWFFEDVDKVGLESPLGLLGLLGWLLTPRSCRGYGATSLTSIPMAKGCSHWQSRSDAECRDRSKGSLWTQQVLLQIVSFAFGIAWQRETFPFESYQKTKLSQNGRMEDRMLWAFIRIRSF